MTTSTLPGATIHHGFRAGLTLLWRLLRYVARHKGLIGLSLAAMVASAAADLVVPELVKRAIDGPIAEKSANGLAFYGSLIVGALLIAALVRASREVLSVKAGRVIGMSLRMDVFRHIQRMSLRFFDKNPVGVLATRVTGDIEAIEQFFASGVAAVFHDILKLGLIVVVMFMIHSELATMVMIVIPLILGAAALFARLSRKAFRNVRAETSATNGYTTEAIAGVRVTRLFQQEPAKQRDYEHHIDRLKDAHLATVRNFAFFFPTVKSLEALAVALVVQTGAQQMLGGQVTWGQFFQFWMYIELFFTPIRNLSENLNLLLQSVASAERIFGVLDHPEEIKAPATSASADAIRGDVSFDDVHFAYNESEPVLRGVSFEAPAGKTVAFVGPTGAGKSSMLNLVSRFYDVSRGAVRVDGRDIREYEPRALRQNIAVVLQDVFLFRGSVLENIRLFNPSIPRERVEAAVQAVHASDMVTRLEGGLDAIVEERGGNLSVGERQLIAFARALVHDPRILVLDEATSSVDTQTELKIQQALDTLRQDRTTLVVAHRLSTIKTADQILVLRRGEIVERGTHQELLEQNGLYRRMYELQVRGSK